VCRFFFTSASKFISLHWRAGVGRWCEKHSRSLARRRPAIRAGDSRVGDSRVAIRVAIRVAVRVAIRSWPFVWPFPSCSALWPIPAEISLRRWKDKRNGLAIYPLRILGNSRGDSRVAICVAIRVAIRAWRFAHGDSRAVAIPSCSVCWPVPTEILMRC
jgi:hypothetical protein